MRIWNVDGATTGIMYSRFYGVFFTLENTEKLIPAGLYEVAITYSPKFSPKKVYNEFKGVPLLKNVKGRSGIRIHMGNYKYNVTGCIAIGSTIATNCNAIFDSMNAYRRLMNYLYSQGIDEFTLDIIDATCTTIADEEDGRET